MSSRRSGDGRPVRRRETARALLIDPDERVLLFHDSDPGLPERPTFWITPGGGVDPGEKLKDAAIREVFEETGHRLAAGSLTGPIARRRAVHGYSDIIVDQGEAFFVARVPAFDVDPAGHTADEVASLLGHRWWTVDELASTSERIWPTTLAGLLVAVLDGPEGVDHTVPMADAEESTVPVG